MKLRDELKFVFVILQYGAHQMTFKCIESIYHCVHKNFHIVVVDNLSPDDSLKKLKDQYGKRKEITILESDENLGFARGNNLGFQYAKEKLHPDFIVLLNNDTELLSLDFIEQIEREYEESRFYVMGPMILTGDGKYISNPVRTKHWTEEEVRSYIKYDELFIKLTKSNIMPIYEFLKGLKARLRKKSKLLHVKKNSIDRQINVELHGSFLIFSPDYIKEYDGLESRTFMYCEEHILYQQMMLAGHTTVYSPTLVIYHAEDASTNETHPKGKEKQLFYLTNHLNSSRILLELIRKHNEAFGK